MNLSKVKKFIWKVNGPLIQTSMFLIKTKIKFIPMVAAALCVTV
jgi:hypothetical protein